MNDDLTHLRTQIDQIDRQILALLTDRLVMAEQVASAKKNGSAVFRPERESQLLSTLCATADPRLHLVIQAVWRAIISAAIARQKPAFTIGATSTSEQPARLFAAGQLAVQMVAGPAELVQQIEAGDLDVGIVQAAELDRVHAVLGLDKPVKIIAGLPLLRDAAQPPTAYILATDRPEPSEHDHYVIYHQDTAESEVVTADQLDSSSGLSVLGICTSIG